MPFESNGTLTTDKKSGSDIGWDTQTEWQAYQSKTDIAINSGLLELATEIPASAVSRWTFDNQHLTDTDGDGTNEAEDIWGSNHGEINGPTTGVSGANKTYTTYEGFSFNGTDNYIGLGTIGVFGGSGQWSIATWLKPGGTGTQQILYPAQEYDVRPMMFDANGNQKIVFQNYDGSTGNNVSSNTSLTLDNWYHAVVTYDAGSVTFYLDGASDGSASVQTDPMALSSSNAIGYDPRFSDKYYSGDLDDFRIYNKQLTGTEVSNLYNTGSISA